MEETPEFIKKQFFEFRKIYRNWFKEISDSFPDQKKEVIKFYKDHMNDSHSEVLKSFFKNINPYIETISNLEYSFFDNCSTFYPQIGYCNLFSTDNGKSDELRKSQFIYITKLTYITLMLSDYSNEIDKENIETYGPMIIKLLTNIQTLDGTNMENMMKNLESAMGMNPENFNQADKNFIHDNPLLSDLAEEIAKEVSIPDSFKNISNPQDIFKLMFDKEGKQFMEGMVKTVGEKIQTKIKSGSISEKDLFNQAQKMMSAFSGNPLFGAMAPGMANMASEETEEQKNKRREEIKKKLRDNIKNRKGNNGRK